MKQFAAGFFLAFALIVAVGYVSISLGLVPVATASPPLPFEKPIAQTALKAAANRQAPKSSPVAGSDSVYAEGAQIYRDNCAICHGLPGQEATAISKGEYPPPPQFFKGKGVTDDPVGITYWKVANGIRLTGMPGFGQSLTTDHMWAVSLMLANGDKLPAAVSDALRKPLNP